MSEEDLLISNSEELIEMCKSGLDNHKPEIIFNRLRWGIITEYEMEMIYPEIKEIINKEMLIDSIIQGTIYLEKWIKDHNNEKTEKQSSWIC